MSNCCVYRNHHACQPESHGSTRHLTSVLHRVRRGEDRGTCAVLTSPNSWSTIVGEQLSGDSSTRNRSMLHLVHISTAGHQTMYYLQHFKTH